MYTKKGEKVKNNKEKLDTTSKSKQIKPNKKHS